MKKNDRVDICQEITIPEIRKLRELANKLDVTLNRTEYSRIIQVYQDCIERRIKEF